MSAFLPEHMHSTAIMSTQSRGHGAGPGRLQGLHTVEGEIAGPVNCIRWFDLKLVIVPDSFPNRLPLYQKGSGRPQGPS